MLAHAAMEIEAASNVNDSVNDSVCELAFTKSERLPSIPLGMRHITVDSLIHVTMLMAVPPIPLLLTQKEELERVMLIPAEAGEFDGLKRSCEYTQVRPDRNDIIAKSRIKNFPMHINRESRESWN